MLDRHAALGHEADRLEDDTPDTLAARVQAAERRIVPEAIRLVAEGRVTIEHGRVRIRS